MASYNRVIMIGNLTRDPEYKQLSSGQAVCRLGLASNRQFKNRQTGQTTQEVCFIDIDVWGAQAESCKQHLQKGRMVLVEGRLKLDSWEDNGQKRSKHSIVADRVTFLSSQNQAQDEMESSGEQMPAESFSSSAASPKKAKSEAKVRPASSASGSKSKNSSLDEDSAETFSSGGEIEFTDKKPFDDELPF